MQPSALSRPTAARPVRPDGGRDDGAGRPARFALPAAIVVLALGAALAMPLAAQTVAGPDARAAMSFQQIADHLSGQGYRDLEEIERKSDKLFEVKLRERDGTRVELLLDARNGEVLKREVKRDQHKNR